METVFLLLAALMEAARLFTERSCWEGWSGAQLQRVKEKMSMSSNVRFMLNPR